MASLEKQRALQKTEKAKETSEIWEAILAVDEALRAAGLSALPPVHVRRAQGHLMRAGVIGAGDLSDDALTEIANVGGSRPWKADMGPIYQNETVFMPDGTFYVCTQPHTAQAGWEPGSAGGRTMFRVIRNEPEPDAPPLDFVWGEHVPYGAIRRDPTNGKYYTPIREGGVTLYEPHYPHLVPSEYKEVAYTPTNGDGDPSEPTEPTEPTEPENPTDPPSVPKWVDLPENYTFRVGDHFMYNSKEYVVLREFNKQAGWAPPALIDNFYKVV